LSANRGGPAQQSSDESDGVPRGWFASAGAQAPLDGPIKILDVEISEEIADVALGPSADGSPYVAAQLLVRLHGSPLGIAMIRVPDTGAAGARGSANELTLASSTVSGAIWTELRPVIERHMIDDGAPSPDELSPAALSAGPQPPCTWRSRLGSRRPAATICIATCGRDLPTLFTTIRSALGQTYDNTRVLVIDNRPFTSTVKARLGEEFPDESRLRYTVEPVMGLAAVRNRSMEEADTECLALTDEDVTLDPDWLGWLVAGFDRPEVACVTGLILPSELESRSQQLIEEFGGFSKGFARRRWDLSENRLDHPVYPYLLGVYGSGANAAWRRSALKQIGGYDELLGTGTRARGGEDLDIYLSCVRAGMQIVYEPGAVVRHAHRQDSDLLRKQVFDYGVGLGAVLMKRFLQREERKEMLSRLRPGLRYLLQSNSPKNAGKRPGFPKRLTFAERMGILYGPFAYLDSRRIGPRKQSG
jgi:GT2 family glycosyltransferase